MSPVKSRSEPSQVSRQLNFTQVNNKLSSFYVTSAVQYLITFYFIDIPNIFGGGIKVMSIIGLLVMK